MRQTFDWTDLLQTTASTSLKLSDFEAAKRSSATRKAMALIRAADDADAFAAILRGEHQRAI